MTAQLIEKSVVKHIEKVLQLCDRHFFARPVFGNNSVVGHYKFGPIGEILKCNIHNEWLYSNVTNSEHSVFPYSSSTSRTDKLDLQEPFQYVKQLTSAQLPFGIADTWLQTKSNLVERSEQSKYFHPQQQNILRTCSYASPRNSTQFFDQWQRHRKIWWRKFSASPGRYSLTDMRNTDEGQVVEIQAAFPWGQETIETITLKGESPFQDLDKNQQEMFEARDGGRRVLPHVVESVTSLERAVFTFLCDAYEEGQLQDNAREVFNFHRKVAPYKTNFSASAPNAAIGEELRQLALYLTKQLRRAGISTLLLPDLARKSLESQYSRNDELGIPYTVVLNESTLKNGIAGLRSRDTTLKEQVHVTELKNYMELLLKNY